MTDYSDDYCSECFMYVSPWEAVHQSECGRCSASFPENITTYGSIKLGVTTTDVEIDNTVNGVVIACDECGTPNDWGTGACYHCGIVLTPEYWEEVKYELKYDEALNAIDNNASAEELLEQFGDMINICCNRFEDECQCDMPLNYTDAWNMIPQTEWEEAYEYNSKCSGCVFYYTATCKPLRAWMLEYYIQGENNQTLDVCGSYKLDPELIGANNG